MLTCCFCLVPARLGSQFPIFFFFFFFFCHLFFFKVLIIFDPLKSVERRNQFLLHLSVLWNTKSTLCSCKSSNRNFYGNFTALTRTNSQRLPERCLRFTLDWFEFVESMNLTNCAKWTKILCIAYGFQIACRYDAWCRLSQTVWWWYWWWCWCWSQIQLIKVLMLYRFVYIFHCHISDQRRAKACSILPQSFPLAIPLSLILFCVLCIVKSWPVYTWY